MNETLTINPYAWNSEANVIWSDEQTRKKNKNKGIDANHKRRDSDIDFFFFLHYIYLHFFFCLFACCMRIDQPAGTGFSYSDPGDNFALSENEIATNLFEFLQHFLSAFPRFQSLPFYIVGESYAGHFVPAFAQRIIQGNKEAGAIWPLINLKGIGIGNGNVDPTILFSSYAPYAEDNDLVDAQTLSMMKQHLPQCLDYISACNSTTLDGRMGCVNATQYCAEYQTNPLAKLYNQYDVRERANVCVPPLCYNFTHILRFVNQPAVLQTLGLGLGTALSQGWSYCNFSVNIALILSGDTISSTLPLMQNILEHDVSIVAYYGDTDFNCDW